MNEVLYSRPGLSSTVVSYIHVIYLFEFIRKWIFLFIIYLGLICPVAEVCETIYSS